MNVLALRPRFGEIEIAATQDRRLARVEVFETMEAAEPHWRILEAGPLLATPYQRYDFIKLWQRHVGAAAGMMPFIVVGFDGRGAPLFLWPLGRRRMGSLEVAEFLGGKHANFNMALWRCGVAGSIEAADLNAVLAQLESRVDLLWLANQPLSWAGTTNPFALLPHQRAANCGFSGALIPDFDALLRARTNSGARKKMRKKERALASLGTVRLTRAANPAQVRRILDVFFKQKSARMRERGIADVFTAPGVRRFVEAAAAENITGGTPLIELYALSVDDMIVATMGGIAGGGRFCAMFNSIAQGRVAVESPGEQLIVNLVRRCCERGFHTFDLGIGEAHYKSLFCDDSAPLFDSFLPLNGRGRLIGYGFRLSAATKRVVKQNTALWSLVRAARRLRARR
jgi:CelD/BcsL family acetyltransferase involved in cellulose biosynthesis